jgi:heme/copper-type cytochrome/quinol oxidase subunit 3
VGGVRPCLVTSASYKLDFNKGGGFSSIYTIASECAWFATFCAAYSRARARGFNRNIVTSREVQSGQPLSLTHALSFALGHSPAF